MLALPVVDNLEATRLVHIDALANESPQWDDMFKIGSLPADPIPDDVVVELAFCPTGPGGGVDNSCGSGAKAAQQDTKIAYARMLRNDKEAALIRLRAAEKAHKAGGLDNPVLKAASAQAGRDYRALLRQQKAAELAAGLHKGTPKDKAAPTVKPVDRDASTPAFTVNPSGLSTKVDPTEHVQNISGGNVNATYKCKLTDGTEVVYKPKSGEDNGCAKYYGVKPGTLYQREAAASDLDHALGFGIVPLTVVVADAPHGVGSAQTWEPNAVSAQSALSGYGRENWNAQPEHQEQAAKMLVLDYLTGNGDRHGNNFMITNSGTGNLRAIDNGFAFSNHEANRANAILNNKHEYESVGKNLAPNVKNLLDNRKSFDGVLKSYKGITPVQRELFWKRAERLHETLQAGKKWTDILYR